MEKAEKNPVEWRRFVPLTNDGAALNHFAELVQQIGKAEIVFILRTVKLHPDFEGNDKQLRREGP